MKPTRKFSLPDVLAPLLNLRKIRADATPASVIDGLIHNFGNGGFFQRADAPCASLKGIFVEWSH